MFPNDIVPDLVIVKMADSSLSSLIDGVDVTEKLMSLSLSLMVPVPVSVASVICGSAVVAPSTTVSLPSVIASSVTATRT